MLRMELLSDAGLSRQILDESVANLLYMADRTGTLWETDALDVQLHDHGFASGRGAHASTATCWASTASTRSGVAWSFNSAMRR